MYNKDKDRVDIYGSGPLVQGWLNSAPNEGGSNGVIVINQSVESSQLTSTETHLENLVAYFRSKGILGNAVLNWAVWMNDGGYTINMAFDGPEAFKFYQEIYNAYPYPDDQAAFDQVTKTVFN